MKKACLYVREKSLELGYFLGVFFKVILHDDMVLFSFKSAVELYMEGGIEILFWNLQNEG